MGATIPEYVLAKSCGKPTDEDAVILSLSTIKASDAEITQEMKVYLIRNVGPSVSKLYSREGYKGGKMPAELNQEVDSIFENTFMDKYNTRSFFLHVKNKYYELSGKSLLWALRIVCSNICSKNHCCCSDDNCIKNVETPHTMSDACFKKLYTTQHNNGGDPSHFKVGNEPERRYHVTSGGKIFIPADALVSLSAPDREETIAKIVEVRERKKVFSREKRLKEQEDRELRALEYGVVRQPRPSESPEGRAFLGDVAAGVEKLKKEGKYDPTVDMIAFSKGHPDYPKEGVMHMSKKARNPLVLKRQKAGQKKEDVEFEGMSIGRGTNISLNDIAFGTQAGLSDLPGGQIVTHSFVAKGSEQWALDAEKEEQIKHEKDSGRVWRVTAAGKRIGTEPGEFEFIAVIYKDVIPRIKSGELGFSSDMTDDTISDLMDRYPEAETNSNFWLSPTWDTTKYVEKKRQHKADVASGKKKSKSKKGPDSKLSKKAAAKKSTTKAKPAGKVEISSRTPSSKASVKVSSLNVNETSPAVGQPGGRDVSPDNVTDFPDNSKHAAKSSRPSSNDFFAAKKPPQKNKMIIDNSSSISASKPTFVHKTPKKNPNNMMSLQWKTKKSSSKVKSSSSKKSLSMTNLSSQVPQKGTLGTFFNRKSSPKEIVAEEMAAKKRKLEEDSGKESGGDEDSKPATKKKKTADTLEYNPSSSDL